MILVYLYFGFDYNTREMVNIWYFDAELQPIAITVVILMVIHAVDNTDVAVAAAVINHHL